MPGWQNIPAEDLVALRAYTRDAPERGGESIQQAVNVALRSRDPSLLERHSAHIRVALSGLNQLPAHRGLVFRAAVGDADVGELIASWYVPGNRLRERSFTSATAREDFVINGAVQYTICSRAGREIAALSHRPDEAEVLFRPGTEFVVLSRRRDPDSGAWHVILREVEAPDSKDHDVVERAEQAWSRRHASGHRLPLPRPDRFEGPPLGSLPEGSIPTYTAKASRMRPTVHNHDVGCLLAGAVGDALGAPVEFLTLQEIRSRYGPGGLSGYDEAYGRRGAITDDTQMTLFTVEALLRDGDPVAELRDAYLRWLQTQEHPRPTGDGLLAVPELHSARAPGNTCLSALRATRAGALGSTQHPINDSKGCGGVMRAAPAGLVAPDPRRAFTLGCDLAAITHGHPSGYLPAGALAAAVHHLTHGATLDTALDTATDELRAWPGHDETATALDNARQLAARGRPTPEDLESLGGGWTGEEALAIAVCAALSATDMRDGLLLAVNHSGDSDSTGALCGNLLGARDGARAIPGAWLDDLELHSLIEDLASRLVR